MLKRKYRLPASVKLTRPTSYKSRSFRLMLTQNNLGFSRFAFTVSKKIDKKAVVRNKIKRAMRDCIQELQEQIVNKYDMLFILQKNSREESRNSLCHEVRELLKEKRLMNDKLN